MVLSLTLKIVSRVKTQEDGYNTIILEKIDFKTRLLYVLVTEKKIIELIH